MPRENAQWQRTTIQTPGLFAPRIVSTVVKRAAIGAEQKTSRELRLYLWLRGIWGHSLLVLSSRGDRGTLGG